MRINIKAIDWTHYSWKQVINGVPHRCENIIEIFKYNVKFLSTDLGD